MEMFLLLILEREREGMNRVEKGGNWMDQVKIKWKRGSEPPASSYGRLQFGNVSMFLSVYFILYSLRPKLIIQF